ncbi:hypothetical protein GLV89_15250 [Halomonas alkaliantarctica]|nr:hypothetical protein [Halomonas alkaliantarctica]
MPSYMGVVIGYSNIKCVFGNDDTIVYKDVFPIIFMPSDRFKDSFMSVVGEMIKSMEVNVDGTMYSVGFEPVKVPGISRSVTENYIQTDL